MYCFYIFIQYLTPYFNKKNIVVCYIVDFFFFLVITCFVYNNLAMFYVNPNYAQKCEL